MTLRARFEKAWAEAVAAASVVVQEKEELFGLIALMEAQGVQTYLELGASEGVSLYCIVWCLPQLREVHVVDPGEPHSIGRLTAVINALPCPCHFHPATTAGALATIQDLVKQRYTDTSKPGLFDAVLIDAGHTYEDVKHDWEAYGPLGKMVIFHDIRLPAVNKLWLEIKPRLRGVEVHTAALSVPGGEKMGFGVVYQ